MTFEQLLDHNPMMNASKAISVITHLMLTQHGALSSETINKAEQRISKYIKDLMLSDESIEKHFYIDNLNDPYAEPVEVNYEYYQEEQSNKFTTVNFKHLLNAFNKCRNNDGLNPIVLGGNGVKVVESNVSDSALCDLTAKISKAVINIVDREDKLKSETVNKIMEECLSGVLEETIKMALPKIKADIRNAVKHRITRGRPSTVTGKMICSAIHLADTVKADATNMDPLKLRSSIGNFDLTAPDRNQVVDVFMDYRKSTKTE